MDFEEIKIADGVRAVFASANRFKTNEIMISFCTPLCKETASRNALLINMLSHTNNDYKTTSEFNKRLAMLYGANVASQVSKHGENQVLSLFISSLDDKFSIEGDSISRESIELLMSLIFNPSLDENGDFVQADIDREKRLLCEALESEVNEKRIYSLRQLEENMFKNEAFSINAYGTIDDIKAVTNDDLKKALDYIKTNSKIQITVVGTADKNAIIDVAKSYFDNVNRDYIKPQPAEFIPVAKEVNTVTERIDVKQGKLVLGFRVNLQSDFEPAPNMRSFSDVLGSGPYSKLFLNVREKLSLCYYCFARYDRRKSSIIIQCGCEEENMDKAVEEILNQIENIKNGNFEDTFKSSKIGLNDTINGVNDDSLMLLRWYGGQIADDKILSPSDSVADNEAVTFDEVKACAELLSLDTIYKLVGNKEGE